MKKTEEQKFLEVKEKLDYFRLPTVFPFQATDLLSKLLSLVPKQRSSDKENYASNINAPSNQLNDALRLQIGKTVKENNRLHSELITAREQIQALKYSIEKHTINRMGSNKQSMLLIQESKKREEELFEELTSIKYKYNELMDLIHQDPNIQKQYLKRLIKHRKYQVPENLNIGSNPEKATQRTKNRKVGQHQIATDLQQKVALLQQKLENRESEITRLQKKVEYDGLNMNKILKDFEADRNQQKISGLEQQITYLEDQNKKMKEQVRNVRKKGGLKQALREETRKNHQKIKNISENNQQLQRKMKQKEYDQGASHKQMQRQIKQIKDQCKLINDDYQQAQSTIKDLEKKIEFLNKELESTKNQLHIEQNGNINKQIVIDQMKNTQEGGKILYQYQIEDLKKKLMETESLLSDYETRICKLSSDNKYYQEQGLLKSQAIENLEKIVDQLMKRDIIHKNGSDITAIQSQTPSIQNALAMKRDMNEIRHELALTKNENIRLQQDLQNLRIRYDQKVRQNAGFSQQISNLKSKIYEVKRYQSDHFESDKIIDGLRIDIRKQQSLRNKMQAMYQDIEAQNTLLKRQLKEISQQYEVYQRKAKNHLNSVNNQKADIAQSHHLLEIRIKDKDRKLVIYQQKIQELQNKVNILRDQVNLLEDEKHSLIRQKHRAEKRYDDALRSLEEGKGKDLQSISMNQNQAFRYKKQISQLQNRLDLLTQELKDWKDKYDRLQHEKEVIVSDKTALIRENDSLKMQCNNLERRIISVNAN